jgi:hypothetical protein
MQIKRVEAAERSAAPIDACQRGGCARGVMSAAIAPTAIAARRAGG